MNVPIPETICFFLLKLEFVNYWAIIWEVKLGNNVN